MSSEKKMSAIKSYVLVLNESELTEVEYQAKDLLRCMGETGEIDDGTYYSLIQKIEEAKNPLLQSLLEKEKQNAVVSALEQGREALKEAKGIESFDALFLHNKVSELKLENDRELAIFNMGFNTGLDAGKFTFDTLIAAQQQKESNKQP